MIPNLFIGENFLLDLYGGEQSKMKSKEFIEESMRQIFHLNEKEDQFISKIVETIKGEDPGIKAIFMNFFLQISVYSYPSAKYMTVNICNYSEKALDIKEKEKEIVERFNCKSCKYQKYCTGKDITLKHKTEAIKKYGKYFKTIKQENISSFMQRQKFLTQFQEITEWKDLEYMLFVPYKQIYLNEMTEFQNIKVVDLQYMGLTLILDNIYQLSSNTEENYHEMMVHPSIQILLHKGFQQIDVLIIGGGDGGAIRQLLKYPQVRRIKIVEIDKDVIRVCRQYFPKLAGSFDHPKVDLTIGDGLLYAKETKDTFDLIICDGTEPVEEQAKGLYSSQFYDDCYKILKDQGLFLIQGQSHYQYKQIFFEILVDLNKYFSKENISLIFYYDPLFEGHYWSFPVAQKSEKKYDLLKFSRKMLNEEAIEEFVEKNDLSYYNYEMHFSAMSMPNELKKDLKKLLK